MDLDEAISRLRELNEPVPRPLPPATEADVQRVEQALSVTLSPSYRQLQLRAGHVTYGTLEPASVCSGAGHTDLVVVAHDGWSAGVPRALLPICDNNGDFFCLTPDERVVFWSHNGVSEETWPDLATWVEEVWLTENAAA